MKSYVLVHQAGDSVLYLSYGCPPRLTPDLVQARRYERAASANSAIRRIAKSPEYNLTVKEIDD